MQSSLLCFRHVILTSDHHLQLISHLPQLTQHFPVAIREAVDTVFDLRLRVKVLHQSLRMPKIVPRYAREEAMDGLELQVSIDEVEPRRAFDVHRRA